MRLGRISSVLLVHATRALRDRVPTFPATTNDVSTTTLGAWYATRLRRRRPAALLVNHTTLLPLLMPLAPAATQLARVPEAITDPARQPESRRRTPQRQRRRRYVRPPGT
jgi:Domain of unknown function (DUF6933)